MQTIELEDTVLEKLNQLAEQAHSSPNDLIKQWLETASKPSGLLTDIIQELPEINAFKGDPVEIQRKMRDEWD